MSIRDTKQAKRLIEAMAPEGEFLAFINEREAQMLRDAGGSGIMTLAGIPSFRTGFEGSPEMGGRGTTESYGFDQSDDGGSGFDDTADVNLGLTKGPTIDTTGEDQEVDNARMMQALGIPPGVTFSGTSNFDAPAQRLPDAKTLVTNLGLYLLGKERPEVRAAIEAIRGGQRVFDFYKNPDLSLNLSRAEKTELGVLKTKQENADTFGALSPKEQERLEELEQKEAEEKK